MRFPNNLFMAHSRSVEGRKRRGYAYVMARCCSLEGYQRVSLEQLMQADRMVRVHLLETGVTPQAKPGDPSTVGFCATPRVGCVYSVLDPPTTSPSLIQQPSRRGVRKARQPKEKANPTKEEAKAAMQLRLRLCRSESCNFEDRRLRRTGSKNCVGFNLEGCKLGVHA